MPATAAAKPKKPAAKKPAAKKPAAKKPAAKKPAAKKTSSAAKGTYQYHFPLELERLRKKHNYKKGVDDASKWRQIFIEAAASAKKLAK